MINNSSPHFLTQQFLEGAAAATRADNAWCASLDKLLKRLHAADFLRRLDVLNLAAPTQADSLRNIINPGTYGSTNRNSCVFTAKRGFQTLGVSTSLSRHIEVDFSIGDGGTSTSSFQGFVYNRNLSTSNYTNTPTPASYYLMGVSATGSPSSQLHLGHNPVSGNILFANNSTSGYEPTGITLVPGFLGTNRYGSISMLYATKAQNGTFGVSSVNLATFGNNIYVGCKNIANTQQYGPVPYVEIAGWGFGDGFPVTSSQYFTFGELIQDFMDDIGAGV